MYWGTQPASSLDSTTSGRSNTSAPNGVLMIHSVDIAATMLNFAQRCMATRRHCVAIAPINIVRIGHSGSISRRSTVSSVGNRHFPSSHNGSTFDAWDTRGILTSSSRASSTWFGSVATTTADTWRPSNSSIRHECSLRLKFQMTEVLKLTSRVARDSRVPWCSVIAAQVRGPRSSTPFESGYIPARCASPRSCVHGRG